MTINEAMRTFRLPNPTTPEDLECRFSGMDGKVLNYGDKVLLAGYYYNGKGSPCYYSAVYELFQILDNSYYPKSFIIQGDSYKRA